MDIVEVSSECAIVQLSRYDLELVHDVLGEACGATEEQFQARTGHSLTECKRLLEKISHTYRVMSGS